MSCFVFSYFFHFFRLFCDFCYLIFTNQVKLKNCLDGLLPAGDLKMMVICHMEYTLSHLLFDFWSTTLMTVKIHIMDVDENNDPIQWRWMTVVSPEIWNLFQFYPIKYCNCFSNFFSHSFFLFEFRDVWNS